MLQSGISETPLSTFRMPNAECGIKEKGDRGRFFRDLNVGAHGARPLEARSLEEGIPSLVG